VRTLFFCPASPKSAVLPSDLYFFFVNILTNSLVKTWRNYLQHLYHI
jgi:hypothetical protein